ncbi:hypothetical protein [Streptomyces sp. bgisy153]|uniref:hypothetical protein n=1 Tax=Streptomyces sp. bgisy153 TaxID=3413793 RepID=UPI003D71AA55
MPITATLLTPAEPSPAVPDLSAAYDWSANRAALDRLLGTWLDSLDVDRLCALTVLCEERMSVHFSAQLLDAVRWEAALAVACGETASKSPVTTVRFGTASWENGVFYQECSAEFVHADGAVSTLDCGEAVAGHLADLSSIDHPDDADTLTVDLLTGRITT